MKAKKAADAVRVLIVDDHAVVREGLRNFLGMLPGMTAAATWMMNGWMKKANVAKLSELLEMAIESGVRIIACQMSMDVMGIKKEDLIDGVEVTGAATFLAYASENAITLSF